MKYSAELLQHSFDAITHSAVSMALLDPQGKVIYVNHVCAQRLGLSVEALAELDYASLFEAPDEARELFNCALEHGQVETKVLGIRCPDGKKIGLEFSLNAFHDEAGAVAGVFCVARNISELQRLEYRLRVASQYARSLLEASLDPLVTISIEGKIMDVNAATEKATGLAREALIGSDFASYFTEPDKARVGYQLVFAQGHVNDYPLALRHTSGSVMDVLYNASTYHDDDGHVAGAFAAARDVTLLRRSQEELESTNREVSLLSQMGSLLQSCQTIDESLPIILATMERLFPGSSGRIFLLKLITTTQLVEAGVWGQFSQDAMSVSPSNCWALRRGHLHDIGFENAINPPCHYLSGQDTPYICIPLQAQGTALGIIHLALTDLKIDAKRKERTKYLASAVADGASLALANLRLRESLHTLSIRDPLTGLYNRRLLDEALVREIRRAQREKRPLAVAMLDLDHFKVFNDSFGHDAGDVVLKEFARLLQGFREGSDIACRFGGEEFVLLLPGLGSESAGKLLENLRQEVSQLRIQHNGQMLPGITVSVGLAIFPEHGCDSESLLKQADNALYRAKEKGRNRIEAAGLPNTAG